MARIGIDLGATKVQGVVLDGGDDQRVTAVARRKTPRSDDPAAVVGAIVEVVEELGGTRHVDGVGVGAPGAVEHWSGTVVQAPNLGWLRPVALGSLLSAALDEARVVVDNDVNAGTLAEHRMGAGRGVADLLGVFWGSGVGGALVLDGRLRRGPTGYAGEIGHVIVHEGGRQCSCGHFGHAEAYAGRACMEAQARRRHAAGEHTALVELAGADRMRSGVLADALAANDAVAVELLDEAVVALGAVIASAVTLVDLDLVVLGGGVAEKLGAPIVGRVDEAVRARLFATASTVRVVPAELGDLAGAVGAALAVDV